LRGFFEIKSGTLACSDDEECNERAGYGARTLKQLDQSFVGGETILAIHEVVNQEQQLRNVVRLGCHFDFADVFCEVPLAPASLILRQLCKDHVDTGIFE
jgi:hypothetical protein